MMSRGACSATTLTVVELDGSRSFLFAIVGALKAYRLALPRLALAFTALPRSRDARVSGLIN